MVGRELHLPILVGEVAGFHAEAKNHFEDDKNVLDTLLAESFIEFFDSELLHLLLGDCGCICEVR